MLAYCTRTYENKVFLYKKMCISIKKTKPYDLKTMVRLYSSLVVTPTVFCESMVIEIVMKVIFCWNLFKA